MATDSQPCDLGTVKQGQLKGKTVELGPLTTYINGPETPGASAVLLIPDVYGFNIPNTRLFADRLAAQGFFVLLPDIFHDDALTAEKRQSDFAGWRARHPQGAQMLQLDRLLTDVHQQYKPKTVSCLGFCWGGHHSVLLAQTEKVSCAIVAHGSFLTQEMVQGIKKPILFLFADNDSQIPDDKRKDIEAILEDKSNQGITTKGKLYPGCGHGWTLRGDEEDPTIAKGAEDAFQEMVSWLQAHGQ